MKVFRPVAADIKISSKYGQRIDPVTKVPEAMHYGVDFATPVGTPVVAAVTGKVDRAGYQNEEDHSLGFGLRVRQIANIDGKLCQVYYGHLSHVDVEPGQDVVAGTRIGLSGNTGKSSGPHLHFEVRPDGSKGVEVEFQ